MTNRAGKHLPDGRTCHDCGNEADGLEAAEVIAAEGIRAEVIDPCTIVPLDKEAILESVKKTGVSSSWMRPSRSVDFPPRR